MKLKNVSRKVLLLLLEASKSLHVFTIYKRSKLPMSEVISAVNRLRDDGYLEIINGEQVKLTGQGYDAALRLGSEREAKESKPWRKIARQFENDDASRDLDFYVPKISPLEKSFFD